MKNNKPNDSYDTPSTTKNTSNTDDIDFIDPVAPKNQAEEQDPYFKQMGDDENTKFVEQEIDNDKPIGSSNGEYNNDDENADKNPPKEAISHEVTLKKNNK